MAQNKRLNKDDIQEDKFIEFVLECYTFLKDNVKIISIVLAIVVIGTVVFLGFRQNRETRYADASAKFTEAITTYKEAETDYLDTSTPDESENNNDDEESEEKATFQDAGEQLKLVFEKFPNTIFADKARFNYAKTLYFQGKYPEARAQFKKVVETHKPENGNFALYAQKAIGNCYEQEGDYENAIAAYEKRAFPPTSQLAPEIRYFAITNAKFNQALCYEKLNALEDAKVLYKEIIDEFQETLKVGLQQKSDDLIKTAKEVIELIELIEEPLELTEATQLESDKLSYEALVAYTDAIRSYKVTKDIGGGLTSNLRKRIRSFDDLVTPIIKNVKSARNAEKVGNQSGALNFYRRILQFEDYGLSLDLYNRALLNYDRLTINENKDTK